MSSLTQVTPLSFEADTSAYGAFKRLRDHLNTRVLGQPGLVDRLLISLLSDGHLLVEGAPGLAKTTAIKALSEAIDCDDHRIQFTPDLLPGDVTGTDVFDPKTGGFRFEAGPIFHNLVLADEINRAPAKVQSALLEAMAERQVTIGLESYPLSDLFLVMATQNPIDQEGTYALPEAQQDRFLMHVRVEHPSAGAEREILQLVRDQEAHRPVASFNPLEKSSIFEARNEVRGIHLSQDLETYLIQLVVATRNPPPYASELTGLIEWGASPRGTIALDRCVRARAWLDGRTYVTPEDVHELAPDILRHRILLSYEARAQGMTSDDVISTLIRTIPLP